MKKNMKLVFSQIHNGSIFDADFDALCEDLGTIEFKSHSHANGGIAVIYAPNGTGKSTTVPGCFRIS